VTATISGDALVIDVEFAWQDVTDATDKRYLAVTTSFAPCARRLTPR